MRNHFVSALSSTGNFTRFPETPPPIAEALGTPIPQIEKGFSFLYLYGGRTLASDLFTCEEEGIAATSEFLNVFNFKLVSGISKELDETNSIFFSQRLAGKIFPGEDPMDKELLYKDGLVLVVKGFFKNVPLNPTIQFDFLIPYRIDYGISDEWWRLSDATFIKTSGSADIEKVHLLMKDVWREKITDDQYNIGIIPITDLRYGADFEFFNAEHGHGNRRKLFMFMGVAMLILILSCLNYLNLISAYAVKREHEVWIGKVHGASYFNITFDFLHESVLLSLLAWVLALLLSILGIRIFEQLMGVVISPAYFRITAGFGFIIAVAVVGLATGFYPSIRAGSGALVKSTENGKPKIRSQGKMLNAFVVSQFILSIALSTSSLIMRERLRNL